MPVIAKTVILLVISNVFMTFACYAHLVPANRIGHTVLTVPQLKILQEVITLAVFVPISRVYLRQPLKLDYLWAGLCLCGATPPSGYFDFSLTREGFFGDPPSYVRRTRTTDRPARGPGWPVARGGGRRCRA